MPPPRRRVPLKPRQNWYLLIDRSRHAKTNATPHKTPYQKQGDPKTYQTRGRETARGGILRWSASFASAFPPSIPACRTVRHTSSPPCSAVCSLKPSAGFETWLRKTDAGQTGEKQRKASHARCARPCTTCHLFSTHVRKN